jgi:uncharacterized protein YodC (DUF2158 family)
MTTQFQAGDVVRLKSGGQKMTVSYHDGGEGVKVRWMTQHGHSRQEVMVRDTLEKVQPSLIARYFSK